MGKYIVKELLFFNLLPIAVKENEFRNPDLVVFTNA